MEADRVMALKDLLDKGRCLIGMHQGEWAFDAAGECAHPLPFLLREWGR